VRLAGLLLVALAASGCNPPPQAMPPKSEVSPREAEVRKFINTYFESWSARDMASYGRTFHTRARIWFTNQAPMEKDQAPMEKEPFLQSQRRAHASSQFQMKEVPLSVEVTIKGNLAHVNVYWELDRGPERVRGYDFFTLVFADRRWQIIALVFNQES
jgi:hypothetical protein